MNNKYLFLIIITGLLIFAYITKITGNENSERLDNDNIIKHQVLLDSVPSLLRNMKYKIYDGTYHGEIEFTMRDQDIYFSEYLKNITNGKKVSVEGHVLFNKEDSTITLITKVAPPVIWYLIHTGVEVNSPCIIVKDKDDLITNLEDGQKIEK